MNMETHPDILEVLKKRVLPYVIRIQDFDVPWPAELWIDGCRQHQEGVAMFNISDHGHLKAEYFGYDNPLGTDPWMRSEAKLVMESTKVSIPISMVSGNPKTRTKWLEPPPQGDQWQSEATPPIKTYDCEINGWVGGSNDTKMRAAHITLIGLPDLHLPYTGLYAPDEDHEFFTMRGTTSRNAVLKLETGEWSIQLTESRSNVTHAERLYHATLTKQDGTPFTLSDEGILYALGDFLAFQVGRWITFSTIVCAPVDPNNWVAERARVNKLASTVAGSQQSARTATDWQTWPNLFNEFWNQYIDPSSCEHLTNAVYHYVEAQRVFDDGSIGQALVAAQSTLQALTRWWNDLDMNFQFGRGPQNRFNDLIISAVKQARLGKDSGGVIDENALQTAINKAADYRNDIDHGRGGNIEGQGQSVVNCQMHHHNLARLLILAKLDYRNRDARGHLTGPLFIDAPN